MTQTQARRTATIQKSDQDRLLTLRDHIQELRNRFLVIILVIIGASLIGYVYYDTVVRLLLAPLAGQKLMYLTPGGGFDFIFKVSLYTGFAAAIPVVVYQLYRYLSPLYNYYSRRFTEIILALSCLLWLGGGIFGYLVALPAALHFLTGFGGEYVVANLTASSYLNFVAAYLLGLAILFQMPIVLMLINNIRGPLSLRTLLRTEPYVVLGVFVLAAVITPTPDVVNQAIVAAPVLVMYQLGIVLVLIQNRKFVIELPAVSPVVPQAKTAELQSTSNKAAQKYSGATQTKSDRPALESTHTTKAAKVIPTNLKTVLPAARKNIAMPLARRTATAPRPKITYRPNDRSLWF